SLSVKIKNGKFIITEEGQIFHTDKVHELNFEGVETRLVGKRDAKNRTLVGAVLGGVGGALIGGALSKESQNTVHFDWGNVVMILDLSHVEIIELASDGIFLGEKAAGEVNVVLGTSEFQNFYKVLFSLIFIGVFFV